MRARFTIPAVLALVLVLGASAVADALVVTDAEQIDRVIDGLVTRSEGRRVDAFLGYVDPLREPVAVRTSEGAREFGDGQEVELAADVRAALGAFDAGSVDVVQRAVERRRDSDDATVALRARTTQGIIDVRASLRRHGDRWLVSRLDVR
jgi:hypothetical protein